MVRYKKAAFLLLVVFVLLCAVVFTFFAEDVFRIFRYEAYVDDLVKKAKIRYKK